MGDAEKCGCDSCSGNMKNRLISTTTTTTWTYRRLADYDNPGIVIVIFMLLIACASWIAINGIFLPCNLVGISAGSLGILGSILLVSTVKKHECALVVYLILGSVVLAVASGCFVHVWLTVAGASLYLTMLRYLLLLVVYLQSVLLFSAWEMIKSINKEANALSIKI